MLMRSLCQQYGKSRLINASAVRSSGAHSTEEAAAVATRASPQDGECQRYVAQITHPDIFVHGGLTVRKPDEHVGAAA
jgi:hypothetical protein